MKITNNVSNKMSELQNKPTNVDKNSDRTKSGNQKVDTSGSASLNLSQRAQDMNKIKEAAMNAPDVNEAKIAKFQSLIDSGEYKVDAKAIADKMVDEHLMSAATEEN